MTLRTHEKYKKGNKKEGVDGNKSRQRSDKFKIIAGP